MTRAIGVFANHLIQRKKTQQVAKAYSDGPKILDVRQILSVIGIWDWALAKILQLVHEY